MFGGSVAAAASHNDTWGYDAHLEHVDQDPSLRGVCPPGALGTPWPTIRRRTGVILFGGSAATGGMPTTPSAASSMTPGSTTPRPSLWTNSARTGHSPSARARPGDGLRPFHRPRRHVRRVRRLGVRSQRHLGLRPDRQRVDRAEPTRDPTSCRVSDHGDGLRPSSGRVIISEVTVRQRILELP